MPYSTTESSSISQTSLIGGGEDEMVIVGAYLTAISPGLVTSIVTLTIHFNDGVDEYEETLVLNMLLAPYASRMFTVKKAPWTTVDFSTTLLGTGTYGLAIGGHVP